MRVLMIIGALLGIGTMVLGLSVMRSDIQLIIAAIGLFAALILFGIGAVLSGLDKQWNFLVDIEERIRDRGAE